MPIADYKRPVLERRLAQLLEEHQAASDQLGRTLGAVETIKLKRQIEALESEIEQVDRQLKELESAPGPSAPAPQTATRQYNPAAVRDLLLKAFTAADFRRLFLYTSHPDLRSLVQEFGSGDGLAKMVDTAIEQCATRDLLPDLLREVQKANPRMYARHEPGLFC